MTEFNKINQQEKRNILRLMKLIRKVNKEISMRELFYNVLEYLYPNVCWDIKFTIYDPYHSTCEIAETLKYITEKDEKNNSSSAHTFNYFLQGTS